MGPIEKHTTPLRRALAACAVGVTALGVTPTAASAQATPEPTPTQIDELCAVVPDTTEFEDVGDEAWADAVRCLAYAGITSGVEAHRYGPAQRVTRGQMASFVARTMDVAVMLDTEDGLTPLPDRGDPEEHRFDDAVGTHERSIERLAAAGIAEGGPGALPPTSFGSQLHVTRAQMASFIVRALDHLTGGERQPTGDHFDDDDGSVHEQNIDALAEAGIVVGYGDGAYRPQAPVLRNSMASYLTRTLAHLHAEGSIAVLPARPDVTAPVAVASPEGVVVTDADGSPAHVVSTERASVAYAVGSDLVAYQGSIPSGIPTNRAAGPVRVWSPEGVEDIPMGPDVDSTELLDARLVDGVPTALVAESGGNDTDGYHQELLLVDLVDGSRTVLDRSEDEDRFAAPYTSGRILPDGDVVVVETLPVDHWIERWSAGDDQPQWTAEFVQADTPFGGYLVEQDGTIFAVETVVDEPTLVITELDPATGAHGTSRRVTVPLFAERGFGPWPCTDFLTDDVLACARDDRQPIGVDVTTGWFQTLHGGRDAAVTEMREGAAG